MKSKQDFLDAATAAISEFPLAAQFYQAQDPRIIAPITAVATMLSMLSMEMDVAAAEPFTKARDMTVRAEASVKGILPFGKPTKASWLVSNVTNTPFTVSAGRRILDTQGRPFIVEAGATIPALGSATVTSSQESETSFNHAVTVSQPFYKILVPKPEAGRHIASISVTDASAFEYPYHAEFVNVSPDQKVFHLLTDEYSELYIEFGYAGIAGYQPAAGEVFTITVRETEGEISLPTGSPAAFEYSTSLFEAGSSITLGPILSPGAAPMDISTMREVIAYPSIYDASAVYLGNFDFLVRRNLSPFRFLSVWNERTEEAVRGANVDNINTLFVSAIKDGVSSPTLAAQIEAIIKEADDSYKISHVTPVVHHIPIEITAKLPEVYDYAAATQQIKDLIVAEYGPDSAWAKRGYGRVLYRRLYNILEDNVPGLKTERADLQVVITDPILSILPEHYRYVDAADITVSITPS